MNQNSKKALSAALLSALLAVLMLCLALPAFANSKLPSFELTPIESSVGDEFTVYLKMKNAAGLEAGNADIFFDNEQLEFLSAQVGEEATSAGLLVESDLAEDNVITLAFLHMDSVPIEHNEIGIIKIVFKAKAEGESQIKLEATDMHISASENEISREIETVSSSVKIGPKENGAGLLENEAGNSKYGNLLLIGGIVVVAAIGIVVIVTVLSRKKTDVNPNKIDIKKD